MHGLLSYLKHDADQPYKILWDIAAIDERMRTQRDAKPLSDFTVVYHFLSFDRNEYVHSKVALAEFRLPLPSIADILPPDKELAEQEALRLLCLPCRAC